jgi:beta-lactamase regulating signal transducer with metallopeptidase domain
MDINWKLPFEVAFQVSLWSIGWILVALVCIVAFAAFFAIAKASLTFFKKTEDKAVKAKAKLSSVKAEN